MNRSCKIPACPWPVLAHHLCRAHLEQAGLVGTCPECRRQFIQLQLRRPHRFCSRRCRCRANARQQIVVPRDRARLHRLYVQEQKSVWEMARILHASSGTICRALRAVDIPRRRPGTIPATYCCECARPAIQGRRCRFHFLVRQAAHHARYRRAAAAMANNG